MSQSLQEKQRMRQANDRKEDLKNYLYRKGITESLDGRGIETLSLFSLEHLVGTVKHNADIEEGLHG